MSAHSTAAVETVSAQEKRNRSPSVLKTGLWDCPLCFTHRYPSSRMPLPHSVRGCVGMHERLRVCSRVHVRVHVHPFARARAAWVCVCLGVCCRLIPHLAHVPCAVTIARVCAFRIFRVCVFMICLVCLFKILLQAHSSACTCLYCYMCMYDYVYVHVYVYVYVSILLYVYV